MRRAPAALLSFLAIAFLAPTPARAFDTIDALPWPETGRFPAYPSIGPGPLEAWVEAGVMRDSNVLRLESGGQGDTVSRFGAGFRTDQRIFGRQRLHVEARGDAYHYSTFDHLDNFSYSAAGEWRWEVGNNLSGTVSLGRDRRNADLAETHNPQHDLITDTRLAATAGYLITPRLRVRGGIAGTRADRESRIDELRTTGGDVGADYVSPLGNTIGVDFRNAHGQAPVPELVDPLGIFVNNDYHEREVALVATYAAPSGLLRGQGRIGHTRRSYTDLPNRDFSGTTWNGTLEWLPGNKTSLLFSAYREPRSIIDISAAHVLVKGFAFGPAWAPTPKLVFSPQFVHERRTFEGDPALTVPGTVLRDELVRTLRFGVGWEPQRHWQVGLALDHGTRDSNFVGRSYHYTDLAANVAWLY